MGFSSPVEHHDVLNFMTPSMHSFYLDSPMPAQPIPFWGQVVIHVVFSLCQVTWIVTGLIALELS
jgi:hypothetical protein